MQIHDPCHIRSHDVSWEPVISLQQPRVVLLDKLSVLCIGPESVLPPGVHFPVAPGAANGQTPRMWVVERRIKRGWSLKLLISVMTRLLRRCCKTSGEQQNMPVSRLLTS